MDKLFLTAPYAGHVELSKGVLKYLQRFTRVALYASVQFINNLETVKKQFQFVSVKQLLGCSKVNDHKIDAFLYIGDGNFHPLALVYGSDCEVICYNPITKQYQVMTKKDVAPVLKRYQGALAKFHAAKTIGVLVSLKPGQQAYLPSLKLQEKYPSKRFYYFVDNNLSFDQLENFNFIDVWVNTACPRIALDDQEQFRKGVVNLRDVL